MGRQFGCVQVGAVSPRGAEQRLHEHTFDTERLPISHLSRAFDCINTVKNKRDFL